MGQETIIGISIVAALVGIIGFHSWLHKLIKFKMDESAILKFFNDANNSLKSHSTEAISENTEIKPERVTTVCTRSKAIHRTTKEEGHWILKQ